MRKAFSLSLFLLTLVSFGPGRYASASHFDSMYQTLNALWTCQDGGANC
jgi:hypothetical protein